jgi:hypothetical protein
MHVFLGGRETGRAPHTGTGQDALVRSRLSATAGAPFLRSSLGLAWLQSRSGRAYVAIAFSLRLDQWPGSQWFSD